MALRQCTKPEMQYFLNTLYNTGIRIPVSLETSTEMIADALAVCKIFFEWFKNKDYDWDDSQKLEEFYAELKRASRERDAILGLVALTIL